MPRNLRGETDTTVNPNTGTFLPASATRDDGDGRKYILLDSGEKFYTRPADITTGSGGGIVHKPDTWNPKTGQWDPGGVDWGKVAIWLGGASIGGAAALSYAPVAATVAPVAGIGETGATTGLAGSGFGTAAVAPVASTGIIPGTTVGEIVGGLGPTGGSLATGTSLVSKLGGWGNLIGLGANVGTSLYQSHVAGSNADKQLEAANHAADVQAQSAKEALDFLKQQYALQQKLQEPYNQLGASSISALYKGLGWAPPVADVPSQPKPLPADPSHIPPGQPFPASWVPGNPALGTPQAPTGAPGPTVRMVAPDGSEKDVPSQFVSQAMAKGATLKPGAQPMSGGFNAAV